MDAQIALMLGQDGLVTGAIYALVALALVLVFSVTRVIFIPQGEFVTYAALSMAAIQAGGVPSAIWLLLGLAVLTLVVEAWRHWRGLHVDWGSTAVWAIVLPAAAFLLYQEMTGAGVVGHVDWWTTLLLVGTGVITVIPLLWFAEAAQRIRHVICAS